MRKSNEAKSHAGTENALHPLSPPEKEPWEESDEEFIQFVEELNAEIGGYAAEHTACVMNTNAAQANAASGLPTPGAEAKKPAPAGNGEAEYA